METKKIDKEKERRRARRVYASFIEYCRIEDETSRRYQAFTENISSTGICILVNEEIGINSLLLITVYLLDGNSSIETRGKVVWVRPSIFLNVKDRKHFDVGIEFVAITEKDRSRIIRYSEKYSAEIPPLKK